MHKNIVRGTAPCMRLEPGRLESNHIRSGGLKEQVIDKFTVRSVIVLKIYVPDMTYDMRDAYDHNSIHVHHILPSTGAFPDSL